MNRLHFLPHESPENTDPQMQQQRPPLHNNIAPDEAKAPLMTTGFGAPVGNDERSLTTDRFGNVLLQDVALIDKLAHFDRERIPERVVHAKGAGAFGYFECTRDCSELTRAHLFGAIGRRTPALVRFSLVIPEKAGADWERDPRGFAIKFYTEAGVIRLSRRGENVTDPPQTQEGNYDLVGNNLPVFFVKDGIKFADLVHSQKRNPASNLHDWDSYWDFLSLTPESIHLVTMIWSDRGTPKSYRCMHGFGVHTFKWVDKDGGAVYVKYHLRTEIGIENLENPDEAHRDPDFLSRDLFTHLEQGKEVSWTLGVQVMSLEEAKTYAYDPFDATKVWRYRDYPLMPIGRLVLNKNPDNFFAQIEQAAFCPATLVPGIEPTPDRLLQARLFSYRDTQRHRLGPNFAQIPVNCPFASRFKVNNYERDGLMRMDDNGGARPMYNPNSKGGPAANHREFPPETDVEIAEYHDLEPVSKVKDEWGETVLRENAVPAPHSRAMRHEFVSRLGLADDYEQPRLLYLVLTQPERDRLARNIAGTLREAREEVQQRMLRIFDRVHEEYGGRVREALERARGGS